MELEAEAMDVLKNAKQLGSLAAIDRAQAMLERGETRKVVADLRQRVFELAEALFQSIRMQHSVKKYHSQRYANLDDIDEPLNDSEDMKKDFHKIRRLGSEQQMLAKINEAIAEYSAKLAARQSVTPTADWPDWRVEFDKYQRKRSAIWTSSSADRLKR
ncbi:MAG: hypothetical protein ACYS76_13140 [Planctomycetota bacterium]|jgi:hypothetical protein